jgi:hypothetical protein
MKLALRLPVNDCWRFRVWQKRALGGVRVDTRSSAKLDVCPKFDPSSLGKSAKRGKLDVRVRIAGRCEIALEMKADIGYWSRLTACG